MSSKRYTVEDVRCAISISYSWRQVCFKCGLTYAGGNYITLKNIAISNGFNYEHFKGQAINKGCEPHNSRLLKDCLKKGVKISSVNLKKKLMKAKIFKEECVKCKNGKTWNGEPLVLQLDHINGDKDDNRLENLRLLCPNCHSQTKTYCVRKDADVKYCSQCNKRLSYGNKTGYCATCYKDSELYLLHIENFKKSNNGIKILTDMSNEELEMLVLEKTLSEVAAEFGISRSSVSKICVKRGIRNKGKDRINKRIFEVSKEDLENLIKTESFCAIGRRFGVSDNAIRKRAKKHGII